MHITEFPWPLFAHKKAPKSVPKSHKCLAPSYRPQSLAVWSLLLTRIVVEFSERSIWGFQSPGVEHRRSFQGEVDPSSLLRTVLSAEHG